MLHPSKGKESAREAGKPSSKALGKGLFFLSAFIWVGFGWCLVGFFFWKAAGKIYFAVELQRWPTALGRCRGSSEPSLAASPVLPRSSQRGSPRTAQISIFTKDLHLKYRMLNSKHGSRVQAEEGRKEALTLDPS